jgi:EmrB/QacA subfamily drug resistance transporter
MGALDNSIVIPARTLIQNQFSISPSSAVWMITLYTLVSAVSMPLVSKLSDRRGRKPIFIAAIITFAAGSLLAGLANSTPFLNSYIAFLAARVIQAVGAGGLIPIATAEISHAFPPEKRGFALGMIGGIYGMASVLGPTLGSFILDFAGATSWGWLFFINIPLSVVAVALGTTISSQASPAKGSFDIAGATILGAAIAALLYALTNINFFELCISLQSAHVYPFLLTFAALIPLLIWIERKAQDPVINLSLFKNLQVIIVFALSFIVGIRFMYLIFIPQFAENALMLKAGSGGYLVTSLALFSGVAAPASGKLIDKFGAKNIIIAGFAIHIIGFLELAYLVPHYMNLATILVGFAFVGVGMGFTMGTPLNYLMLQQIPKEQAATGLATLSLVRSIGITLSPGILVGFIANASKKIVPELQALFPQIGKAATSQGSAAENMRALFESADVTNIMDRVRSLIPAGVQDRIGWMLDLATPMVQDVFQKGLNKGFSNMFVTVAILSAVGLVVAEFLRSPKKEQSL